MHLALVRGRPRRLREPPAEVLARQLRVALQKPHALEPGLLFEKGALELGEALQSHRSTPRLRLTVRGSRSTVRSKVTLRLGWPLRWPGGGSPDLLGEPGDHPPGSRVKTGFSPVSRPRQGPRRR